MILKVLRKGKRLWLFDCVHVGATETQEGRDYTVEMDISKQDERIRKFSTTQEDEVYVMNALGDTIDSYRGVRR